MKTIRDLNFPWDQVGTVPADQLVGTRTELHNAAQYIAATGRSLLPERPDHSQTTMKWSDERQALVGETIGENRQFRLALKPAELTLLVIGEPGMETRELHLDGHSMAEGFQWLRKQVDRLGGDSKKLSFQLPYSILSPMKEDESFAFESEDPFRELAVYYANANAVLRAVTGQLPDAGSVRCWPHHFDIGTLVVLDPSKPTEEARSVGFGLSPGDENYSEPYFYVNPWPVPDGPKNSFPRLDGRAMWHTERWVGAVLPASRIGSLDSAQNQKEVVEAYFLSAFSAVLQLLHAVD